MVTTNEIMVLILSGGLGTRLGALTDNHPKTMMPINGQPFLNYLLRYVTSFGFKNICLLTGYKADIISKYYKNNAPAEMNLSYSYEEKPLGTGGAIEQAIRQHPSPYYLCLNGDSFFPVDLNDFISRSIDRDLCSIALFKSPTPKRYGTVTIDSKNQITNFSEKSNISSGQYCNGGIYLFNKKLSSSLPANKHSVEKNVFPKLADSGKLWGFPFENDFIDIGTPEDLSIAQTTKFLQTWRS